MTPAHRKKLKQTTLGAFLSSSPVAAPYISKRGTRHWPPSNAERDSTDEGEDGSDVGRVAFEREVIIVSDEDEDQAPRLRKRTRLANIDSDLEQEDSSSGLSDREVDEEVPMRRGRKGKKRIKIVDTDSEGEIQPTRRKLIRGIRPSTPDDSSDELDADSEEIIEPRLRARGKKSTFQKNLERLKRRQGRKRGQVQSQSSDEAEGEEEVDVSVRPFSGARQGVVDDGPDASDASVVEDGDDDDDDDDDNFIVEDDNAGPGPELPIAFRNQQDLAYHFKIICQLLVHLATRRPEERHEFAIEAFKQEYFAESLSLARRKLDSLRDSLVASSIWRPDFRKSLEKFPVLEIAMLDFALPGCDACHLGGRKSTRLGRVGGNPYNRNGFEPLSDAGDTDGDVVQDKKRSKRRWSRRAQKTTPYDSDTDRSDDNKNQEFKREFNLGRFCAARTQTFHNFMHWEYALYQTLSREVKSLTSDRRGFVRAAFSSGNQLPDVGDADGIMDWLDQRGIIHIEWHKLKDMMESARKLEMKAKRGEDVD